MTIQLLAEFAELYAKFDAFPEIFRPVLVVVEELAKVSLPKAVKDHAAALCTSVTEATQAVESSKAWLTLQKRKPMAIKEFNPRFDMKYFPGKRGSKDPETTNVQKLKAQVKKETKGARRELKKDNHFLAGEKLKERKEKDLEYSQRITSINKMLDRDQQGMSPSERLREKKRKFK